jgi:hypothetical protein
MRQPSIFNLEEHIVDGKYHRIDGPAVRHLNGYVSWFFEDEYHREGGPAMSWGDTKIFANHGYLHNIDGPAVICRTHGFHLEYFLYGYLVSKELHGDLVDTYMMHLDDTIFKFEILSMFKNEKRHKVNDHYFG